LIDSLNTNVAIQRDSLDPDIGGRITLGNSWDLNDDWVIGASLLALANEKYRNEDQTRKAIGNPENFFSDVARTTLEERSTTAVNLGVNYRNDHMLEIGAYRLNTDESIASVESGTNSNIDPNERAVTYDARIEERELELMQISGQHTFLDTPWLTDVLERFSLADIEASWF